MARRMPKSVKIYIGKLFIIKMTTINFYAGDSENREQSSTRAGCTFTCPLQQYNNIKISFIFHIKLTNYKLLECKTRTTTGHHSEHMKKYSEFGAYWLLTSWMIKLSYRSESKALYS